MMLESVGRTVYLPVVVRGRLMLDTGWICCLFRPHEAWRSFPTTNASLNTCQEAAKSCSGVRSRCSVCQHTGSNENPLESSCFFCRHEQLLLLQMSNYKRATLDEEDVSEAPGEAASSPDRVEVCTCSRTVSK